VNCSVVLDIEETLKYEGPQRRLDGVMSYLFNNPELREIAAKKIADLGSIHRL